VAWYKFRAGTPVPTWVERLEPVEMQSGCTFSVDAIVCRTPEMTYVWPAADGAVVAAGNVIRFELPAGHAEVSGLVVNGAPTCLSPRPGPVSPEQIPGWGEPVELDIAPETPVPPSPYVWWKPEASALTPPWTVAWGQS
jgi:hypothetical protein